MLQLLDANAALLLAAAGFLLIIAEFCLPGWVLPGVCGGVLLICGAYRLALLDAAPAPAAAIAVIIAVALAAGYGAVPEPLGWVGLAVFPWLCHALLPARIAWPSAVLAAGAPGTAFLLLRIAARAVANKTLIQ